MNTNSGAVSVGLTLAVGTPVDVEVRLGDADVVVGDADVVLGDADVVVGVADALVGVTVAIGCDGVTVGVGVGAVTSLMTFCLPVPLPKS